MLHKVLNMSLLVYNPFTNRGARIGSFSMTLETSATIFVVSFLKSSCLIVATTIFTVQSMLNTKFIHAWTNCE